MILLHKYRTTGIKKGVHLSWMHATVQLLFHNFAILHLSRSQTHTVSQLFEGKLFVVPKLQTWLIIAVFIFPITTAVTLTVSVPQISKDILNKYMQLILSVLAALSEPWICRANFSVDVTPILAALPVLSSMLVLIRLLVWAVRQAR